MTGSGYPLQLGTTSKSQENRTEIERVGDIRFSIVWAPRSHRDFTSSDTASSQRVRILNQTVVRFFFGDQDRWHRRRDLTA